ncbi:MAG TPA: ATP-dependent helicase [Microbacteriaceae bacterium]|nr:ATP-dependent helicase [Microbacteriaceae bacterium]
MEQSESVLAELDEQQRAAASALRGPVAILAGAGTGKTRTITHRIAHGVHTGTYAPERVMAVSFTKKAAGELQQRLHHLGVQGVQPRTFHGAALQQLGYFWGQTIGGETPRIINSKLQILNQSLSMINITLDGQALRDVAAEIEWRKVSMLTIDQYEKKLAERGVVAGLESTQLIDVHNLYEKIKQDRIQIDFEDVLLLLTGMLREEPRVADTVQEKYRFFTVDEYQDVSPLQHALLKTWLGDRVDICVVGDVSQTIYSFAGASSEYLRGFTSEFVEAKEFRLEANYRSTPEILTLANNLMKAQPGALQLRARSKGAEFSPSFEWFESEKQEAEAIANSVSNKIKKGTPASHIAILYRSHAQSLQLEEALKNRGVSLRVQAGVRYFERADVKRAVMEIRAQALTPDDRPVFQVVSDVIRGQGWSSKPPQSGTNERERWEVLGALLHLVDEMPKKTTIGQFSDELLRRSKTDHEPTFEAVTLSTIHSAKGLEWPIVWIAGANEGGIPISYAKTKKMIDEERRLFYVAITRAQLELRISGSGKSTKYPSRFLAEAQIPIFSSN